MENEAIVSRLDTLIKEVQENRRWLRVLAWNDILDAVGEALQEDWEYHLYDMVDGETSSRELEEELPKSRNTILNRLDRWKEMGIVIQNSEGKYDKIVPLEVLNFELPELD